MNKSDDFLESLIISYFLNTTPKLCQDLLYIVYIYTGAPRRSWRQIVYLVDGVDLTSDLRHANPTRSLYHTLTGIRTDMIFEVLAGSLNICSRIPLNAIYNIMALKG